jgi:hypothetical protein
MLEKGGSVDRIMSQSEVLVTMSGVVVLVVTVAVTPSDEKDVSAFDSSAFFESSALLVLDTSSSNAVCA